MSNRSLALGRDIHTYNANDPATVLGGLYLQSLSRPSASGFSRATTTFPQTASPTRELHSQATAEPWLHVVRGWRNPR